MNRNVEVYNVSLTSSKDSSTKSTCVQADGDTKTAKALSLLLDEYARDAPIAGLFRQLGGGRGLSTAQAESWAVHLLTHNDNAVYATCDGRLVGALFMCNLANMRPFYQHVLGLPEDEPLVKYQHQVIKFCKSFDLCSTFGVPAVMYCSTAVIDPKFRSTSDQSHGIMERSVVEVIAVAKRLGYKLIACVFQSNSQAKRIEGHGWQTLGEMRYDQPPLAELFGGILDERRNSLSLSIFRL